MLLGSLTRTGRGKHAGAGNAAAPDGHPPPGTRWPCGSQGQLPRTWAPPLNPTVPPSARIRVQPGLLYTAADEQGARFYEYAMPVRRERPHSPDHRRPARAPAGQQQPALSAEGVRGVRPGRAAAFM